MTYTIDIQNDDEQMIDAPRMIQAVTTVLNRHDVARDSSITIVISNNESVQALNQLHRQVDAPTDILSFPADPLPPELSEGEQPYLGDLVIAYAYASEQARRENHDLHDSLCLLVVHGTLHLLGYDHDTPENRAEMWQEQAETLTLLGIDTAIVPALENSDHD